MMHSFLVEKSLLWLKRPASKAGHSCQLVLSELSSGVKSEVPDAIGFKTSGHRYGSVLVESKASRADFLADMKKPHRVMPEMGMGKWRYFLCPEGMIDVAELPKKWGLLYITDKHRIYPVAGPSLAMDSGGYDKIESAFDMYSNERNHERECLLLAKLMSRVSDPNAINNHFKKILRKSGTLQRDNDYLRKEVSFLKSKLR
jgi:hypothetical protein